jgi:hypothetical protein
MWPPAHADGPNADKSRALRPRRTMENRTMKTYTATYNVPLTIEVKADSEDEAEQLADRERRQLRRE